MFNREPLSCPLGAQIRRPRLDRREQRLVGQVAVAGGALVVRVTEHFPDREQVEMLFAHLKRILKLDRLRLRGPNGAKDEFHLAATAQNLRKMAKLIPMPAPAMAG